MDDELLTLRRIVYEAGAAYDSTSLVCNEALTHGSVTEAQDAIAAYEAANLKYGVALLRLIEHIGTLPSDDLRRDEIKKARKFLDLLDREADTVSRRLEILTRIERGDATAS